MNKPDITALIVWRLFRVLLHIVWGFVLALVTGLFWSTPSTRHRRIATRWLQGLSSVLNLQVERVGEPAATPALWVSNHVSWMDIPVLGGVAPVGFLSKAEVAKWPLIGRLAKAGGTLFIQRGSGDSVRVRDQMCGELAAERNVLFFPEGTTTDGHRVSRFFPKLFEAAVLSDRPVQPMVICYRLGEELHPWAPFIGDDDLVAHLLHILAGEPIRVQVAFLPLIYPQDRSGLELSKACEHAMALRLQELHGGAAAPSRLHFMGIAK